MRRVSAIDQNVQIKHIKEIKKYREKNPDSRLTNVGISIALGLIRLIPKEGKVEIQENKK